MDLTNLNIRKRHLPHWEAEGVTYFITFRSVTDKLSVDEQVIVRDHIVDGHGKFYDLTAVIVMDDHAHVILQPIKPYSLIDNLRGIKGVSARKINTIRVSQGSIWQAESFDRIIRDDVELKEKLFYMLHNPVKRGLTKDPWHYHGWWYNTNKVFVK